MTATTAQYRHKWQKGDIVLWDNRCALHSATGSYPIEEQRIHWRTTIMQDAAAQQRAAERRALPPAIRAGLAFNLRQRWRRGWNVRLNRR